MKVAVVTDELHKKEFLSKPILAGVILCFVNEPKNIPADAAVVFDLLFSNNKERVALLHQFLPRPVFINAVTDTLADIDQPFIRINAWPGFLKRKITEAAVLPQQEKIMKDIFEKLGWQYQLVADVTGMVSARIICMMINEAYFTLNEKVSTKEEMDIAMKLGTHYPYGPFEWGRIVGVKKIQELLCQLSNENNLYEVSTLLTNDTIL